MLAVPFLIGALVGGADRLQVPLFVAWIAGYLLSYYAFQTLRVRRRRSRYAEQLAVYGTVATACAVVVLIARPEVMWLALAYAPLLAVNAVYAYRRDDRALVNDLSSVVQACAMAPVAYWVGGGESGGTAAALFAVTALYFTGTVLYVKTMIRERGDAVFYRVSVGYHVLALAAAAVLVAVAGKRAEAFRTVRTDLPPCAALEDRILARQPALVVSYLEPSCHRDPLRAQPRSYPSVTLTWPIFSRPFYRGLARLGVFDPVELVPALARRPDAYVLVRRRYVDAVTRGLSTPGADVALTEIDASGPGALDLVLARVVRRAPKASGDP